MVSGIYYKTIIVELNIILVMDSFILLIQVYGIDVKFLIIFEINDNIS